MNKCTNQYTNPNQRKHTMENPTLSQREISLILSALKMSIKVGERAAKHYRDQEKTAIADQMELEVGDLYALQDKIRAQR